MLFSFEWIKEYVKTKLSPSEVAGKLTMAGIEVEGVSSAGKGITNVFTAEILNVDKHPNADRLKYCSVTTQGKNFAIVCGASNMKQGDKVALALDGATLPGGVVLKRTKIRGIESEGMMCSEVELGLADKSEGIMILPKDAPVGVDINQVLGLDDTLLEVSILPNRADCLSVRGLSREIAAVTGSEFVDRKVKVKEGAKKVSSEVTVEIKDKELCQRYACRIVEGVKVAPSPMWLQRRLEKLGIRAINNVVDATNYVMLEYGQPLHAFDFTKVKGSGIVVRGAKTGEKIDTLDGKTRELKQGMLVICDKETPQAIAGIMGGRESEVTESTTTILLESARFTPASVRSTSRTLGLSSESSSRFEKGVDVEGVVPALDRVAELIIELAGGVAHKGVVDAYPEKHKAMKIKFSTVRAEKLLGTEVKAAEAKKIFASLGIAVKTSGKDTLECVPPSYRVDLKGEADLAEEAARMLGYGSIPAKMPLSPLGGGVVSPLFAFKRRAADALLSLGFLETMNYSFVSGKMSAMCGEGNRVKVLNPISDDMSIMRTSLIPSLLENVGFNIARKNEELRLFELRPVYIPIGGRSLPDERPMLSGVMYGRRSGSAWNAVKENADFYDVKGVVERLLSTLGIEGAAFEAHSESGFFHPGKCARVSVNGKAAGLFGELHPDLQRKYDLKAAMCLFELDVNVLLASAENTRRYKALPKFPESCRDVAFIVPETVEYAMVEKAVKGLNAKLIENIELFDVYYGGQIEKGKKSLALRITYRAHDRTLTGNEVDAIHAEVLKVLSGSFKAEIRM